MQPSDVGTALEATPPQVHTDWGEEVQTGLSPVRQASGGYRNRSPEARGRTTLGAGLRPATSNSLDHGDGTGREATPPLVHTDLRGGSASEPIARWTSFRWI